jgi:hypothetical protein
VACNPPTTEYRHYEPPDVALLLNATLDSKKGNVVNAPDHENEDELGAARPGEPKQELGEPKPDPDLPGPEPGLPRTEPDLPEPKPDVLEADPDMPKSDRSGQRPEPNVKAAAQEVGKAMAAIGTTIRDLFRGQSDLERFPDAVQAAVAEARRYGPGEVAVIQDRWQGKPAFMVAYQEAGRNQARLVEQVPIDTSKMTAREIDSWPVASAREARVWTFPAGPAESRPGRRNP